MKKAVFLSIFVVLSALWAFSDIITFSFIELGTISSDLSGMSCVSCALNIVVSDTAKHEEFPLSGVFSASTGPATTITSGSNVYDAHFAAGGAVNIVQGTRVLVAGSPMFNDSALQANFSDDTGAFRGEFLVTKVSPTVLAMFGLGPKWSPDGSVSITFGNSDVDGDHLGATIGGGTVSIQTPAPIPEASTVFMFLFGIGTVYASWKLRNV